MQSRLLALTSVALAWPLLGGFAAVDDFKLEPGFTLLLNGKNLDGWKTRTGGDSLEGKTEAYKGRFKVVAGKLIIDPKVRGDVIIDTVKQFDGDVHIKFEFLPGKGCNNDLFIRGLKFDLVKQGVKDLKEGEWNQFEIVIKGKKADFICNGALQRTATAKKGGTSFGVRAEYGPIEIRHMRVKAAE